MSNRTAVLSRGLRIALIVIGVLLGMAVSAVIIGRASGPDHQAQRPMARDEHEQPGNGQGALPLQPTGLWEADELLLKLRAEGLAITDGQLGVTGDFYTAFVEGRAIVSVNADAGRILLGMLFFWGIEDAGQFSSVLDTWRRVQRVIASYFDADLQMAYARWVTEETMGAAGKFAMVEEQVSERRFGSWVVRIANHRDEWLGWTTAVDVARSYRPWHDITGGPPAASWADICKGLTLEEIEAFAGPGELRLSIGDSEQYSFGGNGHRSAWVTFENGRAASWSSP